MRYLKSRILKTIRVIRAHDNFLLEVVIQPCVLDLIFHQSTNPRSTIERIFQRILGVSFSRLISPKRYLYVCVCMRGVLSWAKIALDLIKMVKFVNLSKMWQTKEFETFFLHRSTIFIDLCWCSFFFSPPLLFFHRRKLPFNLISEHVSFASCFFVDACSTMTRESYRRNDSIVILTRVRRFIVPMLKQTGNNVLLSSWNVQLF